MKNRHKTLVILALFVVNFQVMSRDKLVLLDFNSAVQSGYDQGILNKNIEFKLAGQKHRSVKKEMIDYKTNKKTNGFNKSAKDSCQWVLFGVLKSMQQKALSLGANAVINIKSNYKSNEFTSTTQYQCGEGFLMSGVALKGRIVRLKD